MFRLLLICKDLESRKQCSCLEISSCLVSRGYNDASEKSFVNEMVKLLMIGFQQPSQGIKEVFSLMMESAAITLQSRLRMQRFESVEFHL